MRDLSLHPNPHKGIRTTNNRKWTKGRVKLLPKVQSIPVYDEKGCLLGFKHIIH